MHTVPQEIRVNKLRNALILRYLEDEFTLSAEFLRVYSPSAQVRGHGIGQEKLQTGKRHVLIEDLTPTGHYALKITFSDGHDSGLYDWDYLYTLCQEHTTLWQRYLVRLHDAHASRDPNEHDTNSSANKTSSCGGHCGHQ